MNKGETLLDITFMLVCLTLFVGSSMMAIYDQAIYILPALVFLFTNMFHLFLIIKQGKSRA